MMNAKECGLCKAQNEEYRVLEQSEHVFVLIPTRAIKEGHIMILPKEHRKEYGECTPQEAKEMFALIEKYKYLLKDKTNQDPLALINFFSHSTQEHVHIHMTPSKGAIRTLIANTEQIEERPKRDENFYQEMKSRLT